MSEHDERAWALVLAVQGRAFPKLGDDLRPWAVRTIDRLESQGWTIARNTGGEAE